MGDIFRSLLERYRVFHSRDAEEVRAFLHGIDFRIELSPRNARELDVCMNGVYLPGVFLGYVQYRAPVSVRSAPARDDYWVHLPVRGRMQLTDGRQDVVCSTTQAGIGSPSRPGYYNLSSETDSAGIRFRVLRSFMLTEFTALLGSDPQDVPEFFPALDLTRGYGRTLAGYLRMAVADLENADSALRAPLVANEFQQFAVNSLLLAQPHSYSEALRRTEKRIAPRDVKRAIDFMQANLSSLITIADIVTAVGTPGSTLFKHFREFHGLSPMLYLRIARLERIRDALLRANEGASVTQIATHWGIGHLGRFSV